MNREGTKKMNKKEEKRKKFPFFIIFETLIQKL